MIYIYIYACEHVHVYKEVQSLSIRKGTNKCESAQHRSIYQRIRDMILDICIFVSIWYVCMQRGSNCEHSQGHRIMWVRTTRSHSHKYPKYEICKFVSISMYTKRFKLWALARAQTYVSSHNTESYTKLPVIWNMYICEYTYVYKEALSVSTRFKVCTGKGRDICDLAQLEFIYKSIYHTIWYMHTCGYMYVYKEVLSVWVREGRDICEFAQHRFIYNSSDNIIHDYISILVNICMLKRGSNCECVQGQEHMWYMKCGVLTATNFKASNSRSKNPARCTKSVFFFQNRF